MLTKRFLLPVVMVSVAMVTCGTMLWGVFSDALRPPGPQEWRRTLKSAEPEDRRAAAQRLGHVPPTDVASVLPDLILALKDRDPSVRAMAAESLGDAVAVGLSRFKGEHHEQPKAAVHALVLTMRDDDDREVRTSAATALYLICRATERMTSSGIPPAPQDSAFIDPQSLASALVAEMERDAESRDFVVPALGLIGPKLGEPPQALLNLLQDPSASTRSLAISSLSQFPRGIDPAIPVLLRDLESANFSHQSDLQAAAQRFKPTPGVLPGVMQAFQSSNANVRRAAIFLVGNLGPTARGAAPALLARLKESIGSKDQGFAEQQLRRDVARALSQVDSTHDVVSALSEMLQTEDPASRDAAASVLGELGPQANGAIPILIDVMKQAAATPGASGYGAQTADALGRIVPNAPDAELWTEKSVVALTAALESDSAPTRSGAAWALGRFGANAKSSLPALRRHQSDSDADVRRSATNSLAQIEEAGTKQSRTPR